MSSKGAVSKAHWISNFMKFAVRELLANIHPFGVTWLGGIHKNEIFHFKFSILNISNMKLSLNLKYSYKIPKHATDRHLCDGRRHFRYSNHENMCFVNNFYMLFSTALYFVSPIVIESGASFILTPSRRHWRPEFCRGVQDR